MAAQIGIGNLDVVIDGARIRAACERQTRVAAAPALVSDAAGGAPLGVITTTAAEERLWRRNGAPGGLRAGASLGDPGRAATLAEQWIAEGCSGLVSFGLAAALAPAMRPGDVVVGEAVAMPDRRTLRCDAGWRGSLATGLRARGLRVVEARIAGADEVPVLPVDRHRAFQATFAAAIDTESHMVAEAAALADLPFLVVRAVADSLDRPLMGVNGAERAGVLLLVRNLLLRPWSLPGTWRAARHCKAALALLEGVPDLLPAPAAAALA